MPESTGPELRRSCAPCLGEAAAGALSLGDLHLPVQITHALTGARGGTDERMLQLLEPYAGQRHRAARLILLGGRLPNRRAHRAPHSRIARL
ncbi:hypothetical protein ACWDF9_07915 [Streptomyces rubiginosohelvolus]